MRLQLVGRVGVDGDGIVGDSGLSRQARRALVFLALERARLVTRDELAEAIWGEDLPRTWDSALRNVVAQLRAFLAAAGLSAALASRSRSYGLALPDGWTVDYEEGLGAVRRAERALSVGRLAEAMEDAWTARAIAAQTFLAGEDGEWITRRRDELASAQLAALDVLAEAALRGRDVRLAVRVAEEAVALAELRESSYQVLMRAHAAAGNRGEALRAHERCRRVLVEEIGVDPGPETEALYLSLLRDDDTLGGRGIPPALRADATLFVGRERELHILAEARAVAATEGPQFVLVTGEPGIGKTRLAARFAHDCTSSGFSVRYGRCEPEGREPYDVFATAGVLPETTLVAGPGGRRQLFGEVCFRVERWSRQAAGGVLVLDDLQWADRASLRLLEHLVGALTDTPVLVVATCRDTEPAPDLVDAIAEIRRLRSFERISLQGLVVEDVARLLRDLSPDVSPALAPSLHARSEGNPFFLVEMLQHLRGGAAPVDVGRVGAAVPIGVQELMRSRMNHLSSHAREALVVGAVIGLEFDIRIVEEVLGDDLSSPLEEAVKSGVVGERADRLGLFGFSHALVRDAIYGEVSNTRRGRLHALVAAALERTAGEDLDSRIAQLAFHHRMAGLAGDPSRAVLYLDRAGDRAMAACAYEEAVEHYEAALGHASDNQTRARLLPKLLEAQAFGGDADAAAATFVKALSIAPGFEDGSRLALAVVRATNFVSTQRAGMDRVRTLNTIVNAAEEAPPAVRAAALARHARNLARFGASATQAEEAAAMSVDAEQLARLAGDPAVLAAAIHSRLSCDQSAELVRQRLALATEAFRLAVQAGDDVTLMDAHLILGGEHLVTGDGAAAATSLRAFATTAHRVSPTGAKYFEILHSGMWALLAGDYPRAEALIEQTSALGREQGQSMSRWFEAAQRFQLARDTGRLIDLGDDLAMAAAANLPELSVFAALSLCEMGRAEEANALFQRLVADHLAQIPRALSWVWVLTLLATACDALGDRSAAALLYPELQVHQGRLVVIQTLPVCLGPADLPLAGLATLLGRPRLAASHLHRATELVRLVGSPPWRARTEVRLARLLLDQGGPTRTRRANAFFETALDTATRLGMDGLVVP